MNEDSGTSGPIVVTGAASGIGAAVAGLLIERGSEVVATDVTPLGGVFDPRHARTVVADLTTPAGRDAIFARVDRLGGLVHCAGVIRLVDPAALTEEQWDLVLDTNLKATFFLLQGALPLLGRGSAVVLMSSVAAKASSTPEAVAYSASKAGVLALTRTFAHYLSSRSVRVNAICPGIIETPMQGRLLQEIADQRGLAVAEVDRSRNATVPLGRAAQPDEVAQVAEFLISERSSYMTGQSINVSGGLITY